MTVDGNALFSGEVSDVVWFRDGAAEAELEVAERRMLRSRGPEEGQRGLWM